MYQLLIKPILDFLFALILCPFLLLLIIVLAPIVYLDDPGPVFYVSQRVGRNGRRFLMYKFRSMKLNAPDIRNADGSTFNSDSDFRVTRVGKILRKTSIDELPQVLNILKGEMSFIGPRPNLPNASNQYLGMEKDRLKVRPGITGYSQAYFRNSIIANERYRYDLMYINDISLLLDFKIFFKTISSVFLQKSINCK